MADAYSQIYIQIIFCVRGRANQIKSEWEENLYKYITGIIQGKGQKLLAINGMPDHIHIFIGMRPSCCLSDLVREIKKSSNDYINENNFLTTKFHWQKGFGAFSYHHSLLGTVINYIANQKNHHQKENFKKEYLRFIKEYQVEYDEKYLFEWID